MTTIPSATATATASPDTAAAIQLRGLHKRYGSVNAVNGVDLDVMPGEVVALLGPNGAGKSTTIDMLLGLTRPDAGSVRLFGTTPQQAVDAGRVGAMLQLGGLLSDTTVRDVLRLVGALHRRPLPVQEVLERAGIPELATRRTVKLSGGQMQRVRFAMAIMPNPDLLVLDEPTAGMDVSSRVEFWRAMRAQVAAGRTVLFATHYLEEADEYADRIVVIRSGRVVADGSTTEVKSVVAERQIRATLPGADATRLQTLPGVETVRIYGDSIELACTDADAALRSLLATYAQARDIEVSGADLTGAFLALTTEEN